MENYMTFSIDDEYTSIDEIRKFIDNASAFISDDSCVIKASLKFTTKVYPTKITCGSCDSNSSFEDLLIQTHKCTESDQKPEEEKKKMKAVIIRTDNSVEQIETTGKYEDIKAIVKGWIEHVTIVKNGTVVGSMYVNEEGKLLDLPYNRIATKLFLTEKSWIDDIVGDALVLGPGDDEGGESGVTEEVIEMINNYAKELK